jgi:hypothetical protein
MNVYFNCVNVEPCEHDLRARLVPPRLEYRAVCNKCNFDVGPVNMSGWTVLYGTSADHNPIVALKPAATE